MQIDNMTKTLPKILKRSYTTVDPKQWMDSRRVLRNTVKTCQNHEKALRTPNSTLLWGKCKMGPPKKTRKETRWETRPREDGHTIQQQGGHLKKALRTPNSTLFAELCKTKLPATKGNKKRDRLGDKLGRQAETKASGRWTHHPTQGNKSGDNGRQGETRPREDGHTIQHRHRQDPREGGHTIQQRETRRGTMGDKGRRDPREGGHTIQHQGGHLKIALKTANSTLFGDKTLNRSQNIVKILHLHKITLEVDTSGWL